MPNYEIREATSEADRAAVFTLRYQLYVEEQGLFGDHADHERRWLTDEQDARAAIWLAECDGEVVGTVRLLWGADQFGRALCETFDIAAFTDIVDERDMAIGSRMLVRTEHRQGPLVLLLVLHILEAVVERGIEVIFGESEPHLVNRWSGIGFRPFGLYEHPVNGTLVRLALLPSDYEYAAQLNSPVAPVLKKWSKQSDARARLVERLSHSQRVISERRERDRFWAEVEGAVSREQLGQLLGDLSESELGALLDNSYALDCDAGSTLIRKGHVSRTLYVLLTGTLIVRDEGEMIAEVGEAGAVLGEVAFFSASERISDVVAGPGGARVLALSGRNLESLIAEQGAAAAKFLLSLTRGLCSKLRERSRLGG